MGSRMDNRVDLLRIENAQKLCIGDVLQCKTSYACATSAIMPSG